ncbi:MAG: pyruvate kinase [Clostridia bacterium]|nr:pyruvate kinase [Clostridia bacterium]
MRKTKIICTLGPSTEDETILRALMKNGMDVARINMSHGSYEEHKQKIDKLKKLRSELELPVAILLDTKGPEIRTGNFPEKVNLEAGQDFTLTIHECDGDKEHCSITFAGLPDDVDVGTRILIDDGLIEMIVKSKTETDIVCKVLNGGPVSSHKGINVPDVTLSLPFLSDKDKEDLKFGVEQDVDFVAASFTRSAEDINEMRAELTKNGGQDIRIIAKIENKDGVNNIDDIVRVSDGIMVARGDLGVEIPIAEIPVIQKMLIRKTRNSDKPVITATQMLDSMIKNPRPTRAETTDVANAIYDGTSVIMLSGETAAGAYPVEAVKTMAKIAETTESNINYIDRFRKLDMHERPDVTSAISHATCTTAHDLGASAIITVSKSGSTSRMLSKYRPECPIISGTPSEKVWRQTNMSWGVRPIMIEEKDNTDDLIDHVIDSAQKKGLLNNGDLVVLTAGVPLGVSGTTNLMKVHLVGNILCSGTTIVNDLSAHGHLVVCRNDEEALINCKEGEILVIHETNNSLLPVMKKCAGIITEVDGTDSHAAIVGLALNKPVIVGAKNATLLLKTGTNVNMYSGKSVVTTATTKV